MQIITEYFSAKINIVGIDSEKFVNNSLEPRYTSYHKTPGE